MAAGGTEYLIAIAAEMSGGEESVATLTALSEEMSGQAGAVASLDEALSQARAALGQTGTAAAEAAAKVAAGESKYAQLEKAADKAAKALERASLKGAVPEGLKKAADEAAIALRAEAVALDATRTSADAAGLAQSRAAASVKNLEAASKGATAAQIRANAAGTEGVNNLNDFAKWVGKLPGPLGAMGKALDDGSDGMAGMSKMSSLATAGAIAMAAAVIALGAALVKGAVNAALWGIGLADTGGKLEALGKTSKEHVAKTFGGLRIDGLLSALEKLVDLFNPATKAGERMAASFNEIFQPMVDAATEAIPVIADFIAAVAKGAPKAIAALRPFMPVFKAIGIGLAIVVGVVVVAIAAIGAAIGLVAAAAVAIGVGIAAALDAIDGAVLTASKAVIASFGAMASGASSAFASVKASVASAIAYLKGTSLSQIGADMIAGLVNGIKSAAGAVADALSGVVNDAISAAKEKLGIASPSKVTEEMGDNVAMGFTGGIDDGAADAQSALERMVEPPSAAAPSSASAPAGKAITLTGPFNFYGVEGAEDAERRFGVLLTRALEGDVAQLGGGEFVPA